LRKKRKVNLSVPAGVDTGSKLMVAGEGESSQHSGTSGDLYVLIHVKPHEFFERQGDDIYFQIPIFFPQAALGRWVEVPTLEGNQLLDIPPGPNSGEVFRIRQGGIKHLRGSGWGDQIIQMVVKTPERLTRRQKELLKEFAELTGQEFNMEKRRKKGSLFSKRKE